jgi:hypothetical protein
MKSFAKALEWLEDSHPMLSYWSGVWSHFYLMAHVELRGTVIQPGKAWSLSTLNTPKPDEGFSDQQRLTKTKFVRKT